MRRTLIFLNVFVAVLVVSPFVSRPVDYQIEEKFHIKTMPTSSLLAQLNIVPNVVNQTDYLEINTVNHVSKQITIHGVLFDYDALHYILYKRADIKADIETYLLEDRPIEEMIALNALLDYVDLRSLEYKDRFFRFEDNIDLFEKAGNFFYQLFSFEQDVVDFNFLNNRLLKVYEVRFYEDFDENQILAGVYGLYHVYDQDVYYLESSVCDAFNLYNKLDELEKEDLMATASEGDYFEEEDCYYYHYRQLDHNLSFGLIEEEFYPHKASYVFDYQSHVSKPYARFRLVFDAFYQEKLMISSETMRVKISKEANDYRNQYNVDPVFVYGGMQYIPVDIIYPHRLIVEEKEGWFYTKSNYFHQMLEGNLGNVKYRKDLRYYDLYEQEVMLGGLELIYDQVGYVEYEPLTTFTFNYGIGDMEHYLKDVYPFLLWGTSAENREDYSMVERFIWDKDRFTVAKQGRRFEKNRLRQYYYNNLENVIIGSDIPISILDEIDDFYQNTR